MKSITETFEDLNSIEIVRDAKGAFKFTVKIYFSGEEEDKAINRIEQTMQGLQNRFEKEAVKND
jgi:hypothetical protein